MPIEVPDDQFGRKGTWNSPVLASVRSPKVIPTVRVAADQWSAAVIDRADRRSGGVFLRLSHGLGRWRPAAGIVLARDRAGIAAAGMPLFAMGIHPNSPASSGPGKVGGPIMLGGVYVSSGDIIVGDEDGVVVIPLAQAEAVLKNLRAVQAAEESALAQVRSGATSFPSWHAIHARAKIVE